MSDAETRAERLGAAMLLLGLVREPGEAALACVADLPLLSTEEWEAWRACDDQDTAIALACLAVEFELRERQWDALERLGRAWASGRGDTVLDRIESMPPAERYAWASAAVELGWLYPMPERDDEE